MKNLKRLIAFAAATAVLAACTVVSGEILPGIVQSNYYDDYTYYDVPADSWYYYYAGFAYEYNIMTGTASGQFSPYGNLTVAEAVTIAARLNAAYYGNDLYNNNNNSDNTSKYNDSLYWFAPYYSYALQQKIITASQFGSRYSEPATRSELAMLLYRALPSCYNKINDITPLPDVYSSNPYYREILSLYEAGVITGNDEYGTFYPYSEIQRCEVAAMVARAVCTDLRQSFSLNPNMPFKQLHYSWNYPDGGRKFALDMSISYYDYNYFLTMPRTFDYSAYATNDADMSGLIVLANTLKQLAADNGLTSDYDVAAFITTFVQNLEYQDDYEYKGVDEYPKYPIETLFEQGGDCEDTSVLLAKLLKLLGYGTVLLVSNDHMAVGLQTSASGNLSIDGNQYYYIETTEAGWRVGEVPGDMLGVHISAIYI